MKSNNLKIVDLARVDIMCAELCGLEEQLEAAIGTDGEAAAKAELTGAIKRMNEVLNGSMCGCSGNWHVEGCGREDFMVVSDDGRLMAGKKVD